MDMCYGVFLRRQQRSIASKGTILASKILLSHEEFQGLVTSQLWLQANLVVQEARLKVAAAELNSAQEKLDDKQRELDKVQALYDGAVREKQVITSDNRSWRRRLNSFYLDENPTFGQECSQP